MPKKKLFGRGYSLKKYNRHSLQLHGSDEEFQDDCATPIVPVSLIDMRDNLVKCVEEEYGYTPSTSSADQVSFSNQYHMKRESRILHDQRFSTCPNCSEKLNVEVKKKHMTYKINFTCNICGQMTSGDEMDDEEEDTLSEADLLLIFSCLEIGQGFQHYERILSSFGMSSKNHYYYKCKRYISKCSHTYYEEKRALLKQCIFKKYAELGIYPDDAGILDIDVSYDGTWMTRGHRSNIGVGIVMEAYTGFALDFEVLCKYCDQCKKIDNYLKEKKIDQAEYENKKMNHASFCSLNFEGSSGAIEQEAAKIIWSRSIDNLQMRYTTFIGDGDSSAYNTVVNLGIYDIIKEECVNHVCKRLGTRLRKLKADHFQMVETKAGRLQKRSLLGGQSKLTDPVINKLTSYFGIAIRNNKDKTAKEMREAILASYFHCSSTDNNQRHHLCPIGEDSWCFVQKAIAKNEEPISHKQMRVKFDVGTNLKLIYNVYADLTTDHLLAKCLKGRTQNPNESLHSIIWSRILKTKFYGLETVKHALNMTILFHNFGKAKCPIHEILKIRSTPLATMIQEKQDKMRKRESLRPKSKKKKKTDMDNAAYQAGNF
jgi:hypothetical protein